MRTRRGMCYPKAAENQRDRLLKRRKVEQIDCRKKSRFSPEFDGEFAGRRDFFDALPDDLVLCVLCKLSSTARCPADFINVLTTCKRLNGLGLNSIVLSKACRKMLAVTAKNWSEPAHRFLKLCADTGNAEACYTLGMIRFYCLHNRGSGASLMAKAAIASHAPALYSLAVVQFNGSGGSKSDKDLRAGVALCARAAFLGHIDALRELGHCLQDGYGVKKNIAEGRRFLIQANARELASVLVACPSAVVPQSWLAWSPHRHGGEGGCPLLSDFGCNVPSPAAHPANQFLTEWFADRTGNVPGPGLRLCSHSSCGRPETRRHEFRRCSVCGAVNYCSRACQALDWKLRHKAECAPVERWAEEDDDVNVNVAGAGGEPMDER
ncbi:HCP-like superfamily protein with MYND-type zinc finger [Perilla frutescens var. hirtella]|uniref:HCP-like superfamily protein with MYND-type zinc finger n=1 Tax=Perilla frutescens var. hirtella TaxID=608512 RepID=A0AAD4P3S8_PERFH|nr:HCP-like superfamily protein with MYND-type zinc finger [Perilla frutescens var. hirtella]KAH6824890.1 HCP-like superfamily protein with MYND-type zinc finger [Perilla frutescens var. hirtella]